MKSYILSIQNIKLLLILIVFFAFSFVGKAQQFTPNTEIGFIGGASYYLGDLNTTHFKNALPPCLVVGSGLDGSRTPVALSLKACTARTNPTG